MEAGVYHRGETARNAVIHAFKRESLRWCGTYLRSRLRPLQQLLKTGKGALTSTELEQGTDHPADLIPEETVSKEMESRSAMMELRPDPKKDARRVFARLVRHRERRDVVVPFEKLHGSANGIQVLDGRHDRAAESEPRQGLSLPGKSVGVVL